MVMGQRVGELPPTSFGAVVEALKRTILDYGLVSSIHQAGENGLDDKIKKWEPDLYKDCIVRIVYGAGVGQAATILGNNIDSLVVATAWTARLDQTSIYVIYHPKVSSEIIEILEHIESNVYGLAALKILIDALEVKIDALEEKLDSIQFLEWAGFGTTGAVYANILDIDARCRGDITIKIANDDAVNSLEYRLRLRAEYDVAEDWSKIADQSVLAGDFDLINVEHKWGRVFLDVRNGTGPADYRFYAIAGSEPPGIS